MHRQEHREQKEGTRQRFLPAQTSSLVVFLVGHTECICGPERKIFREAQKQSEQGIMNSGATNAAVPEAY